MPRSTNSPHRRRLFRGRERAALFIAAAGACERCGRPLTAGWHADHRLAFASGGPTDPANGQALCAVCNLQKGASLD